MEEFLWVEKYRPKLVHDTILSKDLKQKFQTFVEQKAIPNLLLAGGPGVGKTTAARAMLDELGCDYIIINGSKEGGIDTLRTTIQRFASSMSLTGGRKYVILDEADYLSQHMQPALRNFMEEFSSNCGFILTCNYKNRIIKELHSRCAVVDFTFPSEEKPALAKQFMARLVSILSLEKIEYDVQVLAALVKKHFPDFRKMINIMQFEAASGKIDNRVLSNLRDVNLRELVELMKKKNFTAVRKWVAENSNIDSADFWRKFYDGDLVTPQTVPALTEIINKYDYQDAFVTDKEINRAAFLLDVMVQCEFK